VTRQAPHTIVILGADAVVENALALLLEGAGYATRIFQDPSAAGADGLLGGADLVLLAPSLFGEDKDAFLETLEEADPLAGGARILVLSTDPEREPGGRAGLVPWPTPFERLLGEIEVALGHEQEEG
jgi:DNA-binding response OmpR family regulator